MFSETGKQKKFIHLTFSTFLFLTLLVSLSLIIAKPIQYSLLYTEFSIYIIDSMGDYLVFSIFISSLFGILFITLTITFLLYNHLYRRIDRLSVYIYLIILFMCIFWLLFFIRYPNSPFRILFELSMIILPILLSVRIYKMVRLRSRYEL